MLPKLIERAVAFFFLLFAIAAGIILVLLLVHISFYGTFRDEQRSLVSHFS
jgi:hypothetical protein